MVLWPPSRVDVVKDEHRHLPHDLVSKWTPRPHDLTGWELVWSRAGLREHHHATDRSSYILLDRPKQQKDNTAMYIHPWRRLQARVAVA